MFSDVNLCSIGMCTMDKCCSFVNKSDYSIRNEATCDTYISKNGEDINILEDQ